MFSNLYQKVRRLFASMGLLKGIENITEHKDISLNSELFEKIEIWKSLYKGYYEGFHKIEYSTIQGQKTRTMSTLNMAKVSSEEMASLIYNEKCEISIDNDSVAELIEDVFKRNKFDKKFQDFLEYSFAHGGMVIKPYVEDDKIQLSFVTADCFIPVSWKNDSIFEAVFPFEFKKRDKSYTHLEWHLWENGVYVIKNEVYESQNGVDLGIKVPLANHFPGLDEEVTVRNITRSLFSYFKPNAANNIDTNSPLGISIYANALDTMQALDTAFDSLHREFRLGRKRIIVPQHMVKVVYDSNGEPQRYFDSSDETYEAFNGGDMDNNNIQDINVVLRVDEHVNAINALLNVYAMQTGFSSGSFTFDGNSMKTATEVVSEQSKTFKSKQSHEVIIEAALQELIGSIVALGVGYEIIPKPSEYEVTVTFDDSIAEDKTADIKQQVDLVAAGLQSKLRAIIKVHGVTEEEAKEILATIKGEELRDAPEYGEVESQVSLFGAKE